MNRLSLLLSFIAIVLLSGACGDKKKKSYDEIAEITGTNRNNVAIKLHRIKEKLKNMSNL